MSLLQYYDGAITDVLDWVLLRIINVIRKIE